MSQLQMKGRPQMILKKHHRAGGASDTSPCACSRLGSMEGEGCRGRMTKAMSTPTLCGMLGRSAVGEEPELEQDKIPKEDPCGGHSCRNAETYNPSVLIGNYNERRFDLKYIKERKPLPSQVSHYYQTTYGEAFNWFPLHRYPDDLKFLGGRLPHAHPGLQPELDTPIQRMINNSWQTTYRAGYLNPRLRMQPIRGEPIKQGFTCW